MSEYRIYWHRASRTVTVIDEDGAAPGGGAVLISTVEHDHDQDDDNLGPALNHVMYQHIRDALYKVRADGEAGVAMHPDGEYDMQRLVIDMVDIPPRLLDIRIRNGNITAEDGADPIQLNILRSPQGATRPAISFTSSVPAVATVSATGLVTIVGEGTTVITASAYTGAVTDKITVEVIEAADPG